MKYRQNTSELAVQPSCYATCGKGLIGTAAAATCGKGLIGTAAAATCGKGLIGTAAVATCGKGLIGTAAAATCGKGLFGTAANADEEKATKAADRKALRRFSERANIRERSFEIEKLRQRQTTSHGASRLQQKWEAYFFLIQR